MIMLAVFILLGKSYKFFSLHQDSIVNYKILYCLNEGWAVKDC